MLSGGCGPRRNAPVRSAGRSTARPWATLLGRLFRRSGPDRLAGLGAASCDSGLTAGWTVRPDHCWVNAAVSHRRSLETSAPREANLVYLPVVEPAGLGWLHRCGLSQNGD